MASVWLLVCLKHRKAAPQKRTNPNGTCESNPRNGRKCGKNGGWRENFARSRSSDQNVSRALRRAFVLAGKMNLLCFSKINKPQLDTCVIQDSLGSAASLTIFVLRTIGQ